MAPPNHIRDTAAHRREEPMIRRQRLLLTFLAPLALILAACGAAAPAGGDPAGVVRQALSLVQAKDLTALTNLACAAQKEEIADSFTGGLGGSTGMDPQQVLDALSIDTSKVTVGAVTENGDKASVALGGTMAFSFDETKMRELIVAQLEAEGQPTDDATVNMAMGMLTGMLGQPIPMDGQTMDLIREGGAWKICDEE
jgi:hypothetical protein